MNSIKFKPTLGKPQVGVWKIHYTMLATALLNNCLLTFDEAPISNILLLNSHGGLLEGGVFFQRSSNPGG